MVEIKLMSTNVHKNILMIYVNFFIQVQIDSSLLPRGETTDNNYVNFCFQIIISFYSTYHLIRNFPVASDDYRNKFLS